MDKMNIDELAMKVRNKTGFPVFEEDIPKFARALIAEYEKATGGDPVAWHYTVNGAWNCYDKQIPPDDAYDAGSLVPLYTRPDPRVAELEAQLSEANKAMEFNFEQYQDVGRLLNEECEKTERLEAQNAELQEQLDLQTPKEALKQLQQENAALLVAIEAIPKDAIGKILTEVMNNAVSNGANSISMPDEYVEVAAWLCNESPSAELLEARDRVRDAKLIRLIAVKEFSTISIANIALSYLAADRESGEWQPELGD